MSFDFSRIAGDLEDLARETARGYRPESVEPLRRAYHGFDDDELRRRLSTARTSWLLARTGGRFRAGAPRPDPADGYAVVASDGSFILPDRHSPARFYIINIGKVVLSYGERPRATMTAEPKLYFRQEDLFVPDDLRRIPINGPVLGLKRAVEELAGVAAVAIGRPERTLALQDGTLILWALESQPESVARWVLEPYLAAMRRLRDAEVPLAAFISSPASKDFMNVLRVSVCDYPERGEPVNCDHCRGRIATEQHRPACDYLPDVDDRFVFEHVASLAAGERSQVYASTSKILERYDPDCQVYFFYLNTGTEISRVEIPRWVAEDRGALDFTHAVLAEQCALGRGYPSALQEAHELASIRSEDRRAIEYLVEQALARQNIVIRRSGKDGSKRERFI